MIPYSRQSINNKDIDQVKKVLKSDFITQGKNIKKFEDNVCKLVRCSYGVAVNSATSALHIACLALDLKKGDNLWTAANSFVASANCGRYCEANVDFIDIDKDTLNIDTKILSNKLRKTPQKKLPKIIVVVHFAGEPAEMVKLYNLSKRYKFKIIEDASHALGSKIKNDFIGSCKYSDIAVFSFHPVKPITTAEGGMAMTNNRALADKMEILRNHGITRDFKILKKKIKGYWYYEQQALGFNYRMNDIEASLGISQLKRLKIFIKKRQAVAKRYIKTLKNLPVAFQKTDPKNFSSYHLFVICINFKKIKTKYNFLFEYLRKKKIGVNKHYLPIYSQPYYKKLKKYKKLKNVENNASSTISLPIYHDLTAKDQSYVVKVLLHALKK